MADASILDTLPRPQTNRLSGKDHLALLEQMMLIRQFEVRAKELFLKGVIKGTAHSSVGQEAIAVGACHALEPRDFLLTHHRGHGHTIAKGADIGRMFAELMGKAEGYCGGIGGSMHIADFDLNILGANGIVGAGMGLGTGAALAAKLRGDGAVGIAFFGDGASNEGIFHEAMNLCALWQLPLIFFCENNQYGLTTSTESVVAGQGIAARGDAYGVPNTVIDGNSPVAVFDAVEKAVLRARAGEGPTLIEAMTYRWDDHSMRANLDGYRSTAEESGWRARDPITRQRNLLLTAGDIDDNEVDAMQAGVHSTIEAAIDWATELPEPELEAALKMVKVPAQPVGSAEPQPGTRSITYKQAINEAFHLEMARDERVILMGEDVGAIGGIFGTTVGLQQAFGPERVRDVPIAEGVLANCGVGAALQGFRPIIEIQLFDFVTLMMDAIVNQAAKARFMLGGKARVPIVFRGPQGAGIRLAAQHTQSLEMLFANVPGLEVYAPASAYDAKGLMAAAIRSDNPVVFLEHKLLYLGAETPVPEESYEIAPGRARIVRQGSDCTVIATLAMVERAEQAAERLAKKGISVEVIDPRTIKPLDMDTILTSVRKTNRAVVVHEAPLFGSFGGEIAASIMEQAFDWLDAPVARVGAPEMPVPYNDRLERDYMPDARDIAAAIETVCYRR
ncbi:pyruvate dehydrogenase complex E1 component subunit beta [Tateyamaria armeniaca]|uniref:2-oxoglutarate dehydrogenase E1 component n=1 Tax=Tateyamaria armeniaca TaxID=2518930 RepID=A0ABW8UT56_9RHOB